MKNEKNISQQRSRKGHFSSTLFDISPSLGTKCKCVFISHVVFFSHCTDLLFSSPFADFLDFFAHYDFTHHDFTRFLFTKFFRLFFWFWDFSAVSWDENTEIRVEKKKMGSEWVQNNSYIVDQSKYSCSIWIALICSKNQACYRIL